MVFHSCMIFHSLFFFFFFNDTATTEIYTLSLHDALPICTARSSASAPPESPVPAPRGTNGTPCAASSRDRKSTRLNSSHLVISYAVFCLKKKKNIILVVSNRSFSERVNTALPQAYHIVIY